MFLKYVWGLRELRLIKFQQFLHLSIKEFAYMNQIYMHRRLLTKLKNLNGIVFFKNIIYQYM